MCFCRRFLIPVILLATALAVAPCRARDKTITAQIENAFRPPRASVITLSRDGRQLAYAIPAAGGTEIVVVSTDNAGTRIALPLGAQAGAHIATLRWTSGQRLVAVTDTPEVFAVDLAAQRSRKTLDESGFSISVPAANPDQEDRIVPRPPIFLGLHPTAPDRVLLEGIAETENSRIEFASAWLDLVSGKWDSIAETFCQNPRAQVLFDRSGQPRILDTVDGRQRVFQLRPESGRFWHEWRDLETELGGKFRFGFSQKAEAYFGEQSFPVGFAADSDDVLYYATSVGLDRFGLRALNLRTRQPLDFSLDDPVFDLADPAQPFRPDLLVFDRARPVLVGVRGVGPNPHARWLDSELGSLQTTLDARFPDRQVTLVDWSDDRSRVLIRVTSPTNPGRHFVFHRADGRCVEYLRRSPWLNEDEINPVTPFAFISAENVKLTGTVTRPRFPKVARPPLVVLLQDGPGRCVEPGYEPRAQGLAAIGFVVVQLNYRGTAGFGQAFRRAARGGLDQIPLTDLKATLDWLAAEKLHDLRRVALVGEGFGGYLALRAAQEWPALIRCVAAIDAPRNPQELIPPRESANPERDREEFLRWVEQALPGPSMGGGAGGMGGLGGGSGTDGGDGGNSDDYGGESDDGSGGGSGGGSGRRPTRIPPWMLRPPEPIDFTLETTRWLLSGDNRKAAGANLSDRLDAIRATVLLVHDPANQLVSVSRQRNLRRDLRRLDLVADFLEAKTRGDPMSWETQADAWERVGEFLMENLYRYNVKIGEATEQPE